MGIPDSGADIIAWSHPWDGLAIKSPSNLQITMEPTQGALVRGTLDVQNCEDDGSYCTVEYEANSSPQDGLNDIDIDFTYTVTARNYKDISGNPLAGIEDSQFSTRTYSAKLVSKPAFTLTGKTVTIKQTTSWNKIDPVTSFDINHF